MKFSKAEIEFIRSELGIEVGETEENEETLCAIQDAAFEVEAEESNRLDKLSDRDKMAVSLVTRLGGGE